MALPFTYACGPVPLQVSCTMELTNPHALKVRSGVLAYLQGVRQLYPRQIFDFRMPDKIEVTPPPPAACLLRARLVLRPHADTWGRCTP